MNQPDFQNQLRVDVVKLRIEAQNKGVPFWMCMSTETESGMRIYFPDDVNIKVPEYFLPRR